MDSVARGEEQCDIGSGVCVGHHVDTEWCNDKVHDVKRLRMRRGRL